MYIIFSIIGSNTGNKYPISYYSKSLKNGCAYEVLCTFTYVFMMYCSLLGFVYSVVFIWEFSSPYCRKHSYLMLEILKLTCNFFQLHVTCCSMKS